MTDTETPRPYGCKCQTLRERTLGDGCDECNKALVIEMLTDERDELQAEVERLQKELAAWDYGTRAKREQDARQKLEEALRKVADAADDWKARAEKAEAEAKTWHGHYRDAREDLQQWKQSWFDLDEERQKLEAESERRRESLVAMIARNNKLEAELDSLQRLRPTRADVRKLESEVESLQSALDQMTRDAITTAKDRDEWMTRAMVAHAREGK